MPVSVMTIVMVLTAMGLGWLGMESLARRQPLHVVGCLAGLIILILYALNRETL